MSASPRQSEVIRDALLSLYDPVGLAASPLAAALASRGRPASSHAVSQVLLDAIERLCPPQPAPARSHAWRCYHYLKLRYVDCASHAAIATDLGMSLRQATRIHQDALDLLGNVLFPPREALSEPSSSPARPLSERADETRASAAGSDLPPAREPVAAPVAEPAVDVGELVRGVGEIFDRVATAARVRLDSRVPDNFPPIRGNRVILRQILLNLLVALTQARSPAEAETARVLVVEARRTETDIVLSVGDPVSSAEAVKASNVEASLVDAVKVPNVEAASAIAAARELAREAGGRLETSDAGFEITFPAGPPLILLIDDHPDVGVLFERMLGSAYHLVQVRTASRALAVARETLPRAILLDVVLPARDGWEILSALKSDPRTVNIPVAICSVLPDRAIALALGADDFLAKPVARAALLATLQRIVVDGDSAG